MIRNDETYSRDRLSRILSRRRLNFNPYAVSDEELIEIVSAIGWGNTYDIVQMTVVHFTRLRLKDNEFGFDGIYMRVGQSQEEAFIHLSTFLYAPTAEDTLHQTRSRIGKRPIRTDVEVKRMVGHDYFVSRVISGYNIRGYPKPIYQFHRLKGKTTDDADTIRRAMTESRIEMLERLLANPQIPHYLDCLPWLFDIATPIRATIETIKAQAGMRESK